MAKKVERYDPFGLLEDPDSVGPLEPVAYHELPFEARMAYQARLTSSQIEPKDYLTINSDDAFTKMGLSFIPPLDKSVVYHSSKTGGSAYPYVFLSKSFHLFKIAAKLYQDDAALRTIEIVDEEDNDKHLYRLYFVGFFDPNWATQFFMDMAWEEEIDDEVFFNGHKLICGAESYAAESVV